MEVIINKANYYLYWHRRLDTDEVFYVGIGTKKNANFLKFHCEYSRAYSLSGRSEDWFDIADEVGYIVEVLFESNDYGFIKKQETNLILLYGRKNNSTGVLVNLTDGGEGCRGIVYSEAQRIKRGDRTRGGSGTNKRKIIDTKTLEIFETGKEAAKKLGFSQPFFAAMMAGQQINRTSCMFYDFYEEGFVIEPPPEHINNRGVKIIDTKTKFLYHSLKECAKDNNMSVSHLSKMLRALLPNTTYCTYLKNYENGLVIKPEPKKEKYASKVKEVVSGKVYNSLREAAKFLGLTEETVMLRIKRKSQKTPILEYYDNRNRLKQNKSKK